jgi:hypothetical protein
MRTEWTTEMPSDQSMGELALLRLQERGALIKVRSGFCSILETQSTSSSYLSKWVHCRRANLHFGGRRRAPSVAGIHEIGGLSIWDISQAIA